MAIDVLPVTPVPVDPGQRGSGGADNVYRPACAIRLTIRLEDFTNDDGALVQSEGAPARSPADHAIQDAANLRALQAVRRASGEFDPALDAEVDVASRKAARFKSGKTTSTDSAVPQGGAADDHSIEIGIVPTAATLALHGFRDPAKLDFEGLLANLPIQPDVIRSLFCELWMGETNVNDFADPIRWVPKMYEGAPMFRGYAEEIGMEADGDQLTVRVTAVSLEQRLMALKIHPFTKARQIAKGGEPVTRYIQRLISTIPEFNGTYGAAMGVRMWPNVDEDAIPHLDAKLFKRSLQSAASRAQAGGPVQGAPPPGTDPAQDPSNGVPAGVGFPTPNPTVADVSVWDIITRAANLAGVLPIYDPSIVAVMPDGSTQPIGANNLLLIPPQNLMETPQGGIKIPGGPADGFRRDVTIGGKKTSTDVRFFVWGHNIKDIKLSRKFGRAKAPRVRVVCHNPDAKAADRVLTSVFPTTHRATAVSARGSGRAKGHQPIEEEIVRVIREVRSQAALDAYAVALYHSVARHETSVVIETNDMASYYDPSTPADQRNPDVLRLRPGTACRVVVGSRVDSGNMIVNGLSELMDRRFNPGFLRKALLGSPDGARYIEASASAAPTGAVVVAMSGSRSRLEAALARLEDAYASAKLTDWFYTRNVEHRWSIDDGWAAAIELATFQEARNLPANLSKDDAERNDAAKAIQPQAQPDGDRAAVAANLDAILSKKAGVA